MRSLLLASAAIFAGSLGLVSGAQAQDADLSGTDDGQAASTAPAPGTIAVRLNGRFRFYGGLFDDQDVDPKSKTAANKQSEYGFTDYFRLYPGFDGVAANGLKYGASVEVRDDNTVGPGGGGNGSVSAADRGQGTMYIRREWGYLGTDKLGTLRFGTDDGPSSLYLTGTFENFNDGGWNGDVYYGLAQNAQLAWPFADQGDMYATTKAIYLSPQVYGFDFGVSYEPNSNGPNIDDGNCTVASGPSTINVTNAAGTTIGTVPAVNGAVYGGDASTGCNRLSSTAGSDYQRRRNTVDALIRYRAVYAGVGIAATGSYIGSGKVADSATPARKLQYDGLSVGDLGIAVTYGGLQIGGNYQFGRFANASSTGGNTPWSLAPKGAPDASAYVVGASYTVGPVIVGGSWVDVDSAAAVNAAQPGLGQRREQGVAAGGTYKMAPGVGLFLSYLWDQRKEDGYDFTTSSTGTGKNGLDTNNKIRAQALTLGTNLTW